jgi:RluA family pseudouridine synthase
MFANISCYQFAPLGDLKSLRTRLLTACKERELKGTILLAPEGINLFLAGPRAAVDEVVEIIRAIPGLEALTPKYSDSDHQPFNRMLVRLKKEIIAFGVDGIDPARRTSPKLKAAELKRWLDEGRKLTLYDTRNDYEVKMGTFHNALPAGIDTFREFPDAVAQLSEEMKDEPLVMFCTGGIRCEKAGPFMEQQGFKQVYQLDGGILKYFEEVGSDHYDGECFVFDQRVGVDPALRESGSAQCFHCQTPLTPEEQDHPHYQPPHSCPHCYIPDAERERQALADRQAKWEALIDPLPGSVPYHNQRPFTVPAEQDGVTLGAALVACFDHLPPEHWQALADAGRLVDNRENPVGLDQPVRAGEFYAQLQPATTEPDVDARVRLLHEDEAIIVLHKPAPLPMHPGGRFRRNTLSYLLARAYAPHQPRPAHRLDANTSGLVVCARTRRHAHALQRQFEEGRVTKTYFARVHGRPAEDQFTCEAPIGAEPGLGGGRRIDENGQAARTDFLVRSYRENDDTTLLEARPVTGRTHQIRLHLQHLGHPVVGDPLYGKTPSEPGEPGTLPVDAPSLCLHCWKLSFEHPISADRVSHEAQFPVWGA